MISRVFDTLVVVMGVALLVFLLIHLIPGDPVDVMLGESARPADRQALREALGLNLSLTEQTIQYFQRLIYLDLGQSLHQKRPVAEIIGNHFPATLLLAVTAFIFSILIALPMGILAARHPNLWQDRTASLFSILGLSIPNFWLGPLLVLLFSIYLGLTPVSGMEGIKSLVLPALTLGTSLAAVTMRMVRATLMEILNEDYVRTARAKGLSEGVIVWRHALPNASLPIITLMGLQLGSLLAGAVITEMVFSWPGIGQLLIESIQKRDYPLVQGCILVISFSYVLINRLTDILYRVLDPRLRQETR